LRWELQTWSTPKEDKSRVSDRCAAQASRSNTEIFIKQKRNDNSQAWRYCRKKGGLNFLYIRVSTNGTNRNRNSLFPVLAAITTMRGLTIILWIV